MNKSLSAVAATCVIPPALAPPRTTGRQVIQRLLCLAAFLIVGFGLADAQTDQQSGSKLVGTGAVGPAQQGWSVALSADGNTAIVGGIADNKAAGAAWVFTRSGGGWTQQGTKLVGTGAVRNAGQAVSVALSADGNTAIVGGPWDNSRAGAAWVHRRSAGAWTQQGNKLVGTGAASNATQGVSVALSADGNTAVVGGPGDDSGQGAAWVYVLRGGVWTQQGNKLVGTAAVGNAGQGRSVALSADGNTAIVGGPADSAGVGAAWVYTRNGDAWAQLGDKLVGAGTAGNSGQGVAVALSSDGNTAIIGGAGDNAGAGAAWIFARSNGVWAQQGSKLVGTGAVGNAGQGGSVSLSADGSTAIVGGVNDNAGSGAAWVHARSGGVWAQQGGKLAGLGAVGHARQGSSVALSADGNTALVGGLADNGVTGAAWVHTRHGVDWAPSEYLGY